MSEDNIPVKTGLLDLLRHSQETEYVIPVYQRNYTWVAKKEVKQLLDDILAILNGERTKHFIGIMIYLERNTTFLRERSIIDGQQRLTTVFLILYAIKKIYEERGDTNDANKLEKIYLTNELNESNRYKLKPLVTDDEVYQKIVSNQDVSIDDEGTNVYRNFKYIKKTISSWCDRYSLEDILAALNKLYIVCVPIGNEDYPQKIFESINATGAKLTASDLIRNFVLMPLCSTEQEKYYELYWRRIETLIAGDAKVLEAFFRFFLMAKRKSVININAIYRAFVDWYNDNIETMGEEGIFIELVAYAGYYNDIYVADINSLDYDLRKIILEFRDIDSDMPAPLIMELYRLFKNKDENGNPNPLVSAKQLSDIIAILISYLMRRALCGMDTSDITRYFPGLLGDVLGECDGDYSNIVEIFKKNLVNRNKGKSQEMPEDKTLRDRILNANMYTIRAAVFLFLKKLESENNSAPVDLSKVSIEHLMPQTANDQWYAALGVGKDIYDENVHRLGNLTFASKIDNSKMGNNIWSYKNQILANTGHININKSILAKPQWTIQDIDARTIQLIDDIIRLYPYYESTNFKSTKIAIHIAHNDGNAFGYYDPSNGSVEIQQGSELNMNYSNTENYPDIEKMRNNLIQDGIVVEKDGKSIFDQDYTIYAKSNNSTALSTAAALILHGSRNGWDHWLVEDGRKIGDIEGLR